MTEKQFQETRVGDYVMLNNLIEKKVESVNDDSLVVDGKSLPYKLVSPVGICKKSLELLLFQPDEYCVTHKKYAYVSIGRETVNKWSLKQQQYQFNLEHTIDDKNKSGHWCISAFDYETKGQKASTEVFWLADIQHFINDVMAGCFGGENE